MNVSAGTAGDSDVVGSVALTGAIVGVGLIGAADEIVFHQLLQWHNFYVHTDQYWRIFTDGLFHVFTAAMFLWGALRLWDRRHRIARVQQGRPLWAGMLMGIGGFQLFDGIVNHKLLQLHPVREGVENTLVYDLAWNIPAAVLLLVGWLMWRGLQAERLTLAPPHGDERSRRSDRAA